MAARITIGLDLGTSGVKAVCLSDTGRVIAKAAADVALRCPAPGHAEQPVEEVAAASVAVLREVAGCVTDRPIAGLALSGAMHSVVPIDADDQPLAPASTWADRRAAGVADRMFAAADVDALYRHTGCPPGVLYHPARLRWWAGQGVRPARWAAIKDVLLHRLTGAWAADWSVASATGLFDIHQMDWHGPAMELAGVDRAALPPLVRPASVVGGLSRPAAEATGLPTGLPIIAGASDGALANVGAVGIDSDALVITIGTSAAVRRIVRRPLRDERRRSWCYVVDADRWLSGLAMNSGGAALAEAPMLVSRDDKAIAAVPKGADGLTVLPFIHGERDLIWPHDAQWAVLGQTDRHGPAHAARASMEAVACGVAAMIDALPGDRPTAARLTGGVTRSAVWPRIVAEVTGLTLHPVQAADASAIGAAQLARLARDLPPAPPPAAGQPIQPDPAGHAAYRSVRERFAAACRERGWMTD